MNYLQIWLGKKPKKIILDCMKTVLDQVGENDTYTLIATSNFIKNDKVNYININTYEEELKKDENLFKLWKYLPFSGIDDYILASCKSDLIRLYYLSVNDNTIYLDVDVLLKNKLIFNTLTPRFAIEKYGKKDSFISYNGNNKELFKNIYCDIIFICYNIRRDKFYNADIKRSWIFELLNIKYENNSEVIDNINYEHLNMFDKR